MKEMKEYENLEDDDGCLPSSFKRSCCFRALTSMQTAIIVLFLALFTAYAAVFAFWSAPFYTSVRNLAWQFQDNSMSFLLRQIDEQLVAQETMVDGMALDLKYKKDIISNRTLFTDYAISSFRTVAARDLEYNSLVIIDYKNPGIISIVRDDKNYTDKLDDLKYSIFSSIDATEPGNGTLTFYEDINFDTIISSKNYYFNYLDSEWVQQANASSKPKYLWTPTFIQSNPQYGYGNHSFNSVMRMIYDDSGVLLYSVACSVSNLQLGVELDQIVGDRIALIYQTQTKHIIASSDDRIITVDNQTLTSLPSVRIRELKTLIRFVADKFDTRSLNHSQIKKADYFDGPKGSRYLVSVTRILHPGGLDWTIVLASNRNKLVFQSWVAFIAATILGSIFLIVGLAVGVSASFWLTSPIKQLQKEMEKVSELNLDMVKELEESAFSEMKSIQKTFQLTVERLKEYRSFIPAHLLNEIDGNPEDDIVESSIVSNMESTPADRASSFRNSSLNKTTNNQNAKERREAMFKVGLSERPISYIYVKIENFEDIMKIVRPDEWALRIHRELVEQLSKIAIDFKAHLRFDVTSFELFFNTSHDTREYQDKACGAAHAIYEELKKLSSVSDLDTSLNFKICILSLNAFCGNIGSEVNKQAIAWSPDMVKRALNAISIASAWNVDILVDHDTCLKIEKNYMVRPVIDTHLSGDPRKLERLHQLGPKHQKSEGEEWMYEMHINEENSRWNGYVEAYDHLMKREYEEAMKGFEDFLANNPEDELTASHIEALKQRSNGHVKEFHEV